jgi:hypothetical protein
VEKFTIAVTPMSVTFEWEKAKVVVPVKQ